MKYLTSDQPVAPQYFPHTAAKNWVSPLYLTGTKVFTYVGDYGWEQW